MRLSTKQDSLGWVQHPASEPETIEDQEISGDVVLKGSLCIADVKALHQQLNRILTAKTPILICSEGLSRVDAAGVQLLYAFIRTASLSAPSLTWKSISDQLRDAATMLGLNSHMCFEA